MTDEQTQTLAALAAADAEQLARRTVQETYRRNRTREAPFDAAMSTVHTCAVWVAQDVAEGVTPTWTLIAYRLANAMLEAAYGRFGTSTRRGLFWLNGTRGHTVLEEAS